MNATTRFAVLLATFGGLGYSPVSGTAGSLAAVGIAYLAVQAGLPMWGLAVAAVVLFWPGVWAAGVVEREAAKTDPSEVVVDEVIGQWLALAAADPQRWEHWLGAFVLFRLFDVLKPFPIRRFERLPGGWGIVCDDVAAGLCAMIVVSGWRWLTLG
jgi:phosphatidylglycerophosphatase A